MLKLQSPSCLEAGDLFLDALLVCDLDGRSCLRKTVKDVEGPLNRAWLVSRSAHSALGSQANSALLCPAVPKWTDYLHCYTS